MYKLLIVDDEQIEREGMAHFIQWDKYDIQLCGTAWNGADALGKIQKDVPDIVLTDIAGYVMLAPWMFGFLLMWFIPMLISIYYSFTNFNLLNDAKVIGFDNYIRIFTQDETFRQALKVTFIYVLFLVPLRLAFALLVAMLLNKKHKCLGLYRTNTSQEMLLTGKNSRNGLRHFRRLSEIHFITGAIWSFRDILDITEC